MITLPLEGRCRISPPPGSVLPVILPLTYLDIPWLLFPPSQTIFFYSFPVSTARFIGETLPKLKHSLSLTLQHFYPLAGRLVSSTPPEDPHIKYTEGDFIEMIIAESTAAATHFESLTGRIPKIARDLHCLVPSMIADEVGSEQRFLAVQITVFPGSGICIGFTLRNVVADGRTFNNFLKRWVSFFRCDELNFIPALHDRSIFRDPKELRPVFLKQRQEINSTRFRPKLNPNNELVRATLELRPEEMERVKKRILARSSSMFGSSHSGSLLLSPYVVVCSLLWECWIKTQFSSIPNNADGKEVHHSLGFIAGRITRFSFNVPDAYVGNCVGFGRATSTRRRLMDEVNGVVFAAVAIGETIRKLNQNILSGAANWIPEWKELRESQLHLTVVGSPKMDLYGLDFGWGRPSKIEEVSIDATDSVSLFESRDVEGGVELGLALPKRKMEAFIDLFTKDLI